MDAKDLLTTISGGESLTVEFKSDKHQPLNDDDFAELVVCMANSDGGYAFIGVEDAGAITGLGPRRTGESTASIEAMLFNRTEPQLSIAAEKVLYGEHEVLVLRIPKATTIVATTSGRCLRRVYGTKGPECIPYPPIQHASRLGDLGLLDYSASLLRECTLDNVDPVAMARLRSLARIGVPQLAESSDDELLSALQLTAWLSQNERCLTVAGLLCIGAPESLARWLPTHEVAFQVIERDGQVSVNQFLRTPLLNTIEELDLRFAARNQEVEVDVGLVRVGVPDYPQPSFREGLLNALVHRDYARLGAIYIQMHPDHLAIVSPGGFPPGVTLQNLLVHEPVARNPRLAEVFLRLGLVERSGRGIDRIFTHQLRGGRPAPDYSTSDSSAVRLILPGGRPSLRFVQFVLEEESRGSPLDLADLLILNELQQRRRITMDEAGAALQVGAAAAKRRMERLVERGLIAPGRGRGSYGLGPAAYKALGTPAEYVRGRGFEPFQQAAMVEQYVAVNGRIVRSEAAELCKITSPEAKVLLRKMAQDGRLTLMGKRRTAYYTVGPNIGSGAKVIGQVPK